MTGGSVVSSCTPTVRSSYAGHGPALDGPLVVFSLRLSSLFTSGLGEVVWRADAAVAASWGFALAAWLDCRPLHGRMEIVCVAGTAWPGRSHLEYGALYGPRRSWRSVLVTLTAVCSLWRG